jgi:hypothetical protein
MSIIDKWDYKMSDSNKARLILLALFLISLITSFLIYPERILATILTIGLCLGILIGGTVILVLVIFALGMNW